MALTIEQTIKNSNKRKARASSVATTASAKPTRRSPKQKSAASTESASTAAKVKRAKASVRRTVKPWSQASSASTVLDSAGLQTWMDAVVDKFFDRPMPAFIDKSDVKKRTEQIVDIVERGVELGQERVQKIRQKNPVLNELIDVAQKQIKKAQDLIIKK
jgi:hypothetical protein